MKVIQSVLKDLDVAKREVVFAFVKFNDYDSDKDLTLPASFKKTIMEQGPKGSDRIAHLYNHERKILAPIGKVLDLWEDNEFGYARSKMLKNQLATDILDAYEEQAIKEHSYWGQAVNPTKNERGGYTFSEMRLMEVSTVIWGAQEKARLVEMVKKGLTTPENLDEYIKDLAAYVRKGKATDEFLQDIELEIMKFSQLIKSLRPLELAPEPINKVEISLSDLVKMGF
jgi:HK97 family phage prohead protease